MINHKLIKEEIQPRNSPIPCIYESNLYDMRSECTVILIGRPFSVQPIAA